MRQACERHQQITAWSMMGHEQSQAGPEPCVLHPMGQGITGYDRVFDVEKGNAEKGL